MNEIFITNSYGEPAIIVQVENETVLSSHYSKRFPFRFRIYYWIDDEVDSVVKIKKHFERLFQKSRLNPSLVENGGKRFHIPVTLTDTVKSSPLIPRDGQDGGVLN